MSGTSASAIEAQGQEGNRDPSVLAVLMLFALLFMADQEFADGHYTRIAQKAVIKVLGAIGIQALAEEGP